MRKKEKLISIQKANILAEQLFISAKDSINESAAGKTILKSVDKGDLSQDIKKFKATNPSAKVGPITKSGKIFSVEITVEKTEVNEVEDDETMTNKEKEIVESFAKTFNRIKRIDENELK